MLVETDSPMPFTGSRHLLVAAALAMPAVLLFSSVRTFREVDAQREVYLRERAASLAGRLEAASAQGRSPQSAILSLLDEEPHLRDLRIASREAAAGNAALEEVWSGKALFHTRFVDIAAGTIYRAYVPFHAEGVMHVAEIDVDASSADFLTEHARHNVMISVAGGIAIVAISLYSLWALRRSAILERKQLEMRHMAHLGTMSSVLAHEIRNPLGSIKGFAQLAAERGDSGVRTLMNPVIDQTMRLELLVKDLLIYGRPPTPSIRHVQWSTIASRLQAAAFRLAGGKPVAITIGGDESELVTDPDLLEQILVNLIRNALEALDGVEGAKVEVSATRNGDRVVVEVRDNGPGIPDCNRQKVLEAFFTTKASGTGLGLPISARLVDALGGSLTIGTAPGGGALAAVSLPVKG